MNYSLVRAVLGGTWSVDLSTFLQYQQIGDAILHGAHFEFDADTNEGVRYIDPQSGSDVELASVDSSMDGLIAVHSISGIMLKHDTKCGPTGTKTFARNFADADSNPRISAHVVVYDSGGGQSSAVPPLKEVFASAKKPVVAYNDGLMASAALYAGVYCNEIIASPDSMIGSIGVFISFEGWKNASEHEGKTRVRVYADTSSEKNIEFEQALEGNYIPVKENLLNPMDAQFMNDVLSRRPNATEKQLKGGVLFSKDVVGTLVDSLGSLNDAIARASELAELQLNKNNKDMSKKTYPKMAAAAGVELAVTDDGLHLDHSLAEAVEQKLSSLEIAVENYSGLQEGESIQGLRDLITSRTTERDDLKKINDEQAEEILRLTSEVETLSKNPPAEKTGANKDGSDDGASDPRDPMADHYASLAKVK